MGDFLEFAEKVYNDTLEEIEVDAEVSQIIASGYDESTNTKQ